jgi:hypothetical protein
MLLRNNGGVNPILPMSLALLDNVIICDRVVVVFIDLLKVWKSRKETQMSRCYCGCVLALLVIVFAWLPFSWSNIAITVLGAVLAIKAIAGSGCCCCAAKQEEAKSEAPSETSQ